jgi:hypothetical protein
MCRCVMAERRRVGSRRRFTRGQHWPRDEGDGEQTQRLEYSPRLLHTIDGALTRVDSRRTGAAPQGLLPAVVVVRIGC